MDEMKSKDAAYSGERAPVAPMSAAAEVRVRVAPIENAGGAGPTENLSAVASILEIAKASLPGSLGQVAAFLKRTKRVWLMTAGIVIGVAGLVNLSARAAEWAKNARERRQLHAMATLTPESLFARCGAAVVDETKVVYPVLMRTISYHPRGGETLLVSFSRTAEEKSDWVFLSMQNENGTAIYDTPETKIAALPCLDSKKQ
ncbi:MAG TPA: hypothetical protein VNH19_24350 [Candidatus Limnocylindrales bacterium]|nr:hypothetical protein [Candidatus Limnocylindrales bacterium]